MQKNRYADEVTRMLNDINMPENDDNTANRGEDDEIETIHLYIYKELKQSINVVDADTNTKKHIRLCLFLLFLLPP